MDYQNGKIYKLICSETQKIYIGSTCSTLVKRLHQHKRKYNNCMSKTFIEPQIFLIEDFPCERKEQLTGRERYYIENFDCVNKVIPGRTGKEYYQDNKDKINQISKEYHSKNQNNIDYQNKRKEYSEKNKDKVSQMKKEYYKKNKEKILEKMKEKNKEKITCECGSIIRILTIPRHERSKKHLNFLANK